MASSIIEYVLILLRRLLGDQSLVETIDCGTKRAILMTPQLAGSTTSTLREILTAHHNAIQNTLRVVQNVMKKKSTNITEKVAQLTGYVVFDKTASSLSLRLWVMQRLVLLRDLCDPGFAVVKEFPVEENTPPKENVQLPDKPKKIIVSKAKDKLSSSSSTSTLKPIPQPTKAPETGEAVSHKHPSMLMTALLALDSTMHSTARTISDLTKTLLKQSSPSSLVPHVADADGRRLINILCPDTSRASTQNQPHISKYHSLFMETFDEVPDGLFRDLHSNKQDVAIQRLNLVPLYNSHDSETDVRSLPIKLDVPRIRSPDSPDDVNTGELLPHVGPLTLDSLCLGVSSGFAKGKLTYMFDNPSLTKSTNISNFQICLLFVPHKGDVPEIRVFFVLVESEGVSSNYNMTLRTYGSSMIVQTLLCKTFCSFPCNTRLDEIFVQSIDHLRTLINTAVTEHVSTRGAKMSSEMRKFLGTFITPVTPRLSLLYQSLFHAINKHITPFLTDPVDVFNSIYDAQIWLRAYVFKLNKRARESPLAGNKTIVWDCGHNEIAEFVSMLSTTAMYAIDHCLHPFCKRVVRAENSLRSMKETIEMRSSELDLNMASFSAVLVSTENDLKMMEAEIGKSIAAEEKSVDDGNERKRACIDAEFSPGKKPRNH